jgi:hypothetical protein
MLCNSVFSWGLCCSFFLAFCLQYIFCVFVNCVCTCLFYHDFVLSFSIDLWVIDQINSCAKSSWYARRQHSYNICKDFLSHNSWMKNRNFTKKYTDRKTINSNNCVKFEVNWPRGSQFTVRYTKNRLQFDE